MHLNSIFMIKVTLADQATDIRLINAPLFKVFAF
jgi:hypothetical protein